MIESVYNFNGDYKLLKEMEQKTYRFDGIEDDYFYLFAKKDVLDYSIIDSRCGLSSMANISKSPYAKELREKCIEILNSLEKEGYIERV